MKNKERAWDVISKEERRECIQDLINLFKHEKDEEIGNIFAESILDTVLQTVGPNAYNRGIQDASVVVKNHTENLEVDLSALRKS